MKKIKKKLGFWVNKSKQNAIGDILLSTPCTCDSDPNQCDRHWIIDHPDFKESKIEEKMKTPITIAKYLAAKYCNLNVMKKRENLRALPEGKYLILSDIHQGAFAWSWDKEDFFWKNKELYAHVLNSYYQKGFTLIELGDIEEFWIKRFMKSYDEHWAFQRENFTELYDIRRKFHSENRYVKLRGNHDNIWARQDYVNKYLRGDAQLDQIQVYEFATIGDLFLLLHGHQVDRRNRDCDSTRGLIWTRVGEVIEFFTDTILFGKKKPDKGWKEHPQAKLVHERTIANDIYNKEKLNRSFAKLSELMNVYLINGHNHAPKCLPEGDKEFNSGCSVFEGIVYGISIDYDNDFIRLVDWNDDHGMPNEPLILCEQSLSELKYKLKT